MGEVYTIRDLDKKTKNEIQEYAHKHGLKIGQAVRELVVLAKEHLAHTEKEKKYKSIFDAYDQIKFKGGKELSKRIDEVVYG